MFLFFTPKAVEITEIYSQSFDKNLVKAMKATLLPIELLNS